MYDLNRAQILGRLVAEPELKKTKTGIDVCTISLATNRSVKKGENEWESIPEFTNVILWQKKAEAIAKHGKKGIEVYVEGRLQTDSWEKDGVKFYKTSIVADQLIIPNTKKTAKNDEGIMEEGNENLDDLFE